MKLILSIIIFISLLIPVSAFGQYFDTPGLVNRFPIKTGGEVFEVKVVSNFDIPDSQFNSDEKRLSFIISSSVTNNLAEFEVPKNLISGNFTFYLDNKEIFPKVKTNELISFITAEFPGKGLHKFDIIGTTYLSDTNDADTSEVEILETDSGLWILIIGIIAAAAVVGAIFLKKRKVHSLTKD